MLGIQVPKTIGIGDAVQFTSLPENYYKSTGKILIDTEKHWVFDYNPYVLRGAEPEKVFRLWNFNPNPRPRNSVYVSLAEKHACILDAKVFLKHPRLYRFEGFPFQERKKILFQTHGVSHGTMPFHVIDHVYKKYGGGNLFHIGHPTDPDLGIKKLPTPTVWDLVREISECRMLIGMDSGPSWIGACFPDVIVKKLRTKPTIEQLQTWLPLEIDNIHSHWDDRLAQIYNPSEDDVGFTLSYRKI